MQCVKCEGMMKEVVHEVRHPVMTHWTMPFRMMDCDCGWVSATEEQRERNDRIYERTNKFVYKMFR